MSEPDRPDQTAPPIRDIPPDAGRDFRADDRFYRIEPAWVHSRRLSGLVGALVLSGVLTVPAAILWFGADVGVRVRLLAFAGWVLISLLALVRAVLWPGLAYRRYLYRADGARLQIRRGVLWREVLDVPRNRIQHTDVGQGPIERAFEIAHLIVHTAGTTSASVRIEGLREAVAYRIRDELLEAEGDDVV